MVVGGHHGCGALIASVESSRRRATVQPPERFSSMSNTVCASVPPRALVVDDDPFVRIDVADIVESLGYEVFEACSVAEALQVIDQNQGEIALLVTDVMMPGTRNGVTLANHVSCVWPGIRIIVNSGARRPFPGQLPDVAQFFAKPLSAEQLRDYAAAPAGI